MNDSQRIFVELTALSEAITERIDKLREEFTLPNGKTFYRQKVKHGFNSALEQLHVITNYTLRGNKKTNDEEQKQMQAVVDFFIESFEEIWDNVGFAENEEEALIEQEKSNVKEAKIKKVIASAKYTLESRLKRLDLTEKEIEKRISKLL